jgi:Polysulphide reductase, NrfD
MSGSDVTRHGLRGTRPGRDAVTGAAGRSGASGRWRRGKGGERPMVPRAEFVSYYGRPVLKLPVWEPLEIAGYFFLGGLAAGSSLLAAGADVTGRPALSRVAKAGAATAISLSMAALVKDLGRPGRFLNMLRVFKVTSPMSVGTWVVSGFAPSAIVAGVCALTGRLPKAGAAATGTAAVLAPAVASYTAALIGDTAVPAWHEGYPEMPFIFTGSASMAAGGLGLLGAPLAETVPARNLALIGYAMEASAFERMRHRAGLTAETYARGRAGNYLTAGQVLAALGATGALLSSAGPLPGRVRRVVAALSGTALMSASAATRFGIFHAGVASAADPKYTVVPQRQRLTEREEAGFGGSAPATDTASSDTASSH